MTGTGRDQRRWEKKKKEKKKTLIPFGFAASHAASRSPPATRSSELQDKLQTGSRDDASHAANWLSPALSAALRIYAAAADDSWTDVLTLTLLSAPPTSSPRPSSSPPRQECNQTHSLESAGLSIMAAFDHFFVKIQLNVLPPGGAKQAINSLFHRHLAPPDSTDLTSRL